MQENVVFTGANDNMVRADEIASFLGVGTDCHVEPQAAATRSVAPIKYTILESNCLASSSGTDQCFLSSFTR